MENDELEAMGKELTEHLRGLELTPVERAHVLIAAVAFDAGCLARENLLDEVESVSQLMDGAAKGLRDKLHQARTGILPQ